MDDKARTLLIIAAYNEEENLGALIRELKEHEGTFDFVIINDGSVDATAAIGLDAGAKVLLLPTNLGIGGAIQTGYRYARDNGYDIAVQVDGDGQHDIAYLEDVIRPILAGEADYSIGSRFVTGEGFQSSMARRTGIRFLSWWIRCLCGVRVRDVTSGYRAVDRRFIELFAEDYPDDYPEPKAIISAALAGGRIAEVPVIMRERSGGVSSINLRRSIYYMIKVTLDILVCRIGYGLQGRETKKR